MAYITINVSLDEFDLDELLNEIESRHSGYRSNGADKKIIEKFCKDTLIESEELNIYNLSIVDELKFEYFKHYINRISLGALINIIHS